MAASRSAFHNLSGEAIAYLAATIAISLSRAYSNADINILAGLFTAIGDSLAIIAARNQAEETAES